MTFSRLTVAAFSLLLLAGPAWAQDSDEPQDKQPGINSELVSALRFRGIGPAFMSGRIGDIAVDPYDRSIWYVVASSGGVWKTTNAGVTFTPIFDNYGSYSIGCVAIDPNDRFTIWIGTGENNSQRSVSYGDGVYKSTDGGQSFTKVGLENSEHIGKIVVHPADSNTVFVAAQGPLWKEGGDRGLYKTTDGGKTWAQVLKISDHTGVNEVHLDPMNPDIMYATSYQRRRHQWVLIDGGPESTVYKSTDGGATWRKINRGLPGGELGRIGMAISPVNPEVVYAVVEATAGQSGFYRSTNRGESWQRMSDHVSESPQYYQEIVACPHKLDRVYSLGTNLWVTEDGGTTFVAMSDADKHVDNHAIVVDPADEDHLLIGCDGGLYETWDRGKSYDYKANLPITQFYRVAVSREKPFYYVYGGTQDNATQGGPSRTNNVHGIRNSDWFVTVFGDGFDPAVDPEDPDTVYSQWQHGGLVRFNRKTGEAVDIKPQESAEGPTLKWHWDSPLLISPHNNKRLYFGSQILFRSDDRGDNWTAISPDLTRQIDRNKLKVMDRVWGLEAIAKNNSTSLYGSLVAVNESPVVQGLLYCGTDDGLIQVSEDGGQNWRKIEKFGTLDVPEYAFVSDIETDLFDGNTVYVSLDNHKRGDFRPYILKSTDRGQNWSVISGNLPERGTVYTLKQDHVNPKLLFAGTEFGCFCSVDGGEKWLQIRSGLPTIQVREIEIQRDENDLVLATFGRGFMILDDYSPLRDLSPELLEKNHMFPIKKGQIYRQVAPMAGGARAFQGSNFYTAPNPEYGVTFTYYLKDSLKSKKSVRQENDRKATATGKDVFYPSWEDLKAEDREVGPAVWLTIRDAAGNVVRKLPGSTSKGMTRANWDLRHAAFTGGAGGGGGRRGGRGGGGGAAAVPGKYTVEVSKMVDGEITQLIPPAEFEIEPLGFGDLTEINRQEILTFCDQVAKLSNAVTAASQLATEAADQLAAVEQLTQNSAQVDPANWKEVRAMQLRLLDLQQKFTGDPTRSSRNEDAMPGISGRLTNAMFGAMGSTTGPTGTHRKQFEIAGSEYEKTAAELRTLLETELPALLAKFDSLGAPWTPGRKLPDWKR